MKKLKKQENIFKLILIINLIFMVINIISVIIKQYSTTSQVNWILIIILFALNIILLIKAKHNNYKRNIILMISIIVLSMALPVIYETTYQRYEEKYVTNNGTVIGLLKADGGVYRIEHYKNIYGINIYKINHKPSGNVRDIN